MKYCQKCGKELVDEAVICIGCGCSVQENVYRNTPVVIPEKKETSTLASLALVFAFLSPIVGLILGIVGVCSYKNSNYKSTSVGAIVASIVVWVLCIFVLLIAYGM